MELAGHDQDVSEIGTLFRFCPRCGKRFHVRLVSKKPLDEIEERTVFKEGATSAGIPYVAGRHAPVTTTVDPGTTHVQGFRHSYRCGGRARLDRDAHRREIDEKPGLRQQAQRHRQWRSP